MSCIIKKIKNIIYSKRKQILFALFALICSILDKSNTGVLKCAAPAVVVAAAGASGSAATGAAATGAAAAGATASTSGAVAGTAGTASTAAEAKGTATAVKASSTATSSMGNVGNTANSKPVNPNTSVPKNTNPKSKVANQQLSSNLSTSMDDKSKSLNNSSAIEDDKKKKKSSNYLMKPFAPSKSSNEEDDEITIEEGTTQFKSSAPTIIGALGCGSILLLVFFVPLLILGIINASSSTLSQIDCDKQSGNNCEVDNSIEGFFNKLKNLFVYGAYGSNSEVVLKKIEDAYDSIKDEYNFIISLPLLTSSMFSDAIYVESDAKNGNIVITDEMMERIVYIYDMALLQLIPWYDVYECIETDDGQYSGQFKYSITPTYDDDDTTEEDMEAIPTGVCNFFTAGGLYKEVTYYFDLEKYFKRLKNSEELDLVYNKFIEEDELLVSKIRNQYTLYKTIYDIDEEMMYKDISSSLIEDDNINLQTPLKGWYSITSPFGNREGQFSGMHTGIDLVASNKNIYAAGNGVVTRSNVEIAGGNVIEITHTNKYGKQYVTQYAHLRERHVSVGDIVNVGDVIGIMGDTGTMASGVHLHFAIWEKDSNEFLNPRNLFNDTNNY